MPFGRIARYAAVGLLTFGVYLAAGQAALQLGFPLAARAFVPFTLAVVANYLLQRHWVFEDRRPASASLTRYVLMVTLGYAINLAVLAWAPAHMPLPVVQTAAAVLVVASNAVLAFSWVFFDPGSGAGRRASGG
jgi:putative flippase GtrA